QPPAWTERSAMIAPKSEARPNVFSPATGEATRSFWSPTSMPSPSATSGSMKAEPTVSGMAERGGSTGRLGRAVLPDLHEAVRRAPAPRRDGAGHGEGRPGRA